MTITWPITINGKTFNASDFTPFGYVNALPDVLGNFVAAASANLTATGGSATAAAGSATAASGSATAAGVSASSASTSATASSASATAAAGSATAAAGSATAAAAAAASLHLPTISATFGDKLLKVNDAGTAWVFSGITETDAGAVTTLGSLRVGTTLGIGMAPVNVLDIAQNQNAFAAVRIQNNSAGAGTQVGYIASNGTNAAQLTQGGTALTPSGVVRADGTLLTSNASTGGLTITTGAVRPIYVGINNTQVAQFDPTSSGLLIGYTASNGAFKLQVNSQIFATSATINTSDIKFKTNKAPIPDGALDLVLAFKPTAFDFIQDDVHNFPVGRQIGFIAQDVRAALAGTDYLNSLVFENTREEQPAVEARDAVPEQPAVLDEEGNVITPAVPAQDAVAAQPAIPGDTFLGLADAGFTPLIVKALQEIAARLEALEAKTA